MKKKGIFLVIALSLLISSAFLNEALLGATPCLAGGMIDFSTINMTIEDMETEVFKSINKEREKKGLKALKFDKTAYKAAKSHSKDMAKRKYFSHSSPEGEKIKDRLKALKFDVSKRIGGENISYKYNIPNLCKATVDGWINSPGHYKNIMNPNFHYGAIGAAMDKKGAYYFTQVFLGK